MCKKTSGGLGQLSKHTKYLKKIFIQLQSPGRIARGPTLSCPSPLFLPHLRSRTEKSPFEQINSKAVGIQDVGIGIVVLLKHTFVKFHYNIPPFPLVWVSNPLPRETSLVRHQTGNLATFPLAPTCSATPSYNIELWDSAPVVKIWFVCLKHEFIHFASDTLL